jgi:hypothetical protein
MSGNAGSAGSRIGTVGVGAVLSASALVAGALVADAVPASAATASAATVVASYTMNQATSPITDATGKHPGVVTKVGRTVGASGAKGDLALNYTVDPSYVTVANAADLNPGKGAFSFTLKVKTSTMPTLAIGGDYDLIRKGLATTAGGSWKMEIMDDGRALCNLRAPNAQTQLWAGKNLVDGTWHSIICARTSSAVTMTVDGVVVASGQPVKGSISNSSPMLIGAKTTSGEDQTTGAIDNVTITAG